MAAFFTVLGCLPLSARCAGKGKRVAYEPAVVTLGGTIVREVYGNDAAPRDRGHRAWILRLDRRISVPAKADDEVNTEEKNVTEVQLNTYAVKHRMPKDAFGKVRYLVTGTLYHAVNTHHLRPIVMIVSTISPTAAKPGHD